MDQAETLKETALKVTITSEAPYALNVILDMLNELAQTLDFTEMYTGEIVVETLQGKPVQSWLFGKDWTEHE